MPSDRYIDFTHFSNCFLHTVLADVAQAGIMSCDHRFRTVSLRHRDNPHVLTPSSTLYCRVDARPYFTNALI
jgi:hypothetical protein